MRSTLVIEFDHDEDATDFVGWFLDGGGEYQWHEAREDSGKPTVSSEFEARGSANIRTIRMVRP